MKKILTTIVILAFSISILNAQEAFNKGNSGINVGIGFGTTGYLGSYYKIAMPGISASYEYGITEIQMGSSMKGLISAGAFFGFGSSKYEYWANYYYKYNYMLIAVRGNYHFLFHEKFDPYAGIVMGYFLVSGKWSDDATHLYDYTAKSDRFHFGVYAGARWFFNDFFGAFAEVGWGMTVINLGLSLKF